MSFVKFRQQSIVFVRREGIEAFRIFVMDEMHILRGYLTGEVQQKDKRNSDINDVYVFFLFFGYVYHHTRYSI